MDEEERDREECESVALTVVYVNKQKQVVVKDGDQEHGQKEEGKGGAMKKMKKGLKRFLRDLTTPRLFVFKMIYFSLLAGVVILWPQFTVHQAALGLTVAHTGICSAVVAGVGIVVPFLSGVLGDKIGNYKIMLIISTLLVAVLAFLFSVVPSARIPTITTITPNYTTTITTTTTTYATVNLPTPANSTSSSSSLDLVDDDLLPFTFWSYLSVRVAYGVLQAVSYILFEAAVMAEAQATGVDYGFQRAWGTLAVLGASLLSGYLVELTSGFSILFYVSTALQVVAAALMLFLRLEFKPPAVSLTSKILRHTANAEVLMFFAAILAAGFSLLVNPWWVIPLEILESVSNGLLSTVGVMYCTVLFSLESIATFRGIFTVLHFGVGQLVGAASGSWLQDVLGDRGAFRALAGVAFVCVVAYALAYYAFRRCRRRKEQAGASTEYDGVN